MVVVVVVVIGDADEVPEHIEFGSHHDRGTSFPDIWGNSMAEQSSGPEGLEERNAARL